MNYSNYREGVVFLRSEGCVLVKWNDGGFEQITAKRLRKLLEEISESEMFSCYVKLEENSNKIEDIENVWKIESQKHEILVHSQ